MISDELLYKIVYCIAYAFNGFIVYTFMSTFFDKQTLRVRKWVSYLCYVGYVLVTSLGYLIFNIAIINLMTNVLGLAALTFMYSATLQKRFLAALYTYIFLFTSEIAVYLLTGYNDIPIFEKGFYRDIYGAVICRVLSFAAAVVLKNFKAMKNKEKVPAILWVCTMFVPVSTMILQTIVIYYIKNRYVLILSVCVTVLLNVVSFMLYDAIKQMYAEIMKAALVEQEKEHYYNQCRIMQSSAENMRKFRHDITNHLCSLHEMLENGRYKNADDYIQSLIKINGSGSSYSNSGNVVIDSILNYKLQRVAQLGCTVKADIALPAELELDPADMTIILSNLIDNACEALEKTDKREYSLKIIYTKGRLMIHQQNSYSGKVKRSGGKIATSKKDAENHGLGLGNIKDAAMRYNGIFKTEYDDRYFYSSVLLYLSESVEAEENNISQKVTIGTE